MESTRTNIKDITDAELARKTHPNISTTGIDLIVLKTIDNMASEEVRKYNEKIKTINSVQKELNSLREKDDEDSENRKKELEYQIRENNNYIERYKQELDGGKIATDIIDSIKNSEVKNPENAIRENLQLVGYNGKELDKVTPQNIITRTQVLLNLKFRNNDIRNEYSKKNLNYFDTLTKDVQAVNPGVPRG